MWEQSDFLSHLIEEAGKWDDNLNQEENSDDLRENLGNIITMRWALDGEWNTEKTIFTLIKSISNCIKVLRKVKTEIPDSLNNEIKNIKWFVKTVDLMKKQDINGRMKELFSAEEEAMEKIKGDFNHRCSIM